MNQWAPALRYSQAEAPSVFLLFLPNTQNAAAEIVSYISVLNDTERKHDKTGQKQSNAVECQKSVIP